MGGIFRKCIQTASFYIFRNSTFPIAPSESALFPCLWCNFPKWCLNTNVFLWICAQVALALCFQGVAVEGSVTHAVCSAARPPPSFATEWVTLHLAMWNRPQIPTRLPYFHMLVWSAPPVRTWCHILCSLLYPNTLPRPLFSKQGRRQPNMVEWWWILVLQWVSGLGCPLSYWGTWSVIEPHALQFLYPIPTSWESYRGWMGLRIERACLFREGAEESEGSLPSHLSRFGQAWLLALTFPGHTVEWLCTCFSHYSYETHMHLCRQSCPEHLQPLSSHEPRPC